MSRYPTPPHSQTDSNSITLSAYQQRTESRTNQLRSNNGLPPNLNQINLIQQQQQQQQQQQRIKTNQPINSNNATTSSQDQSQINSTIKTHYDLLNSWLHKPTDNSSTSPPNRTNPRDKLTRLTRQQFQELSTDVYDELVRRIGRGDSEENQPSPQNKGDPFLASRDDFHPKRNQARQKLATLPRPRFKDLASDVFYELERRYPEFLLSEPSASLNHNTNTHLANKLPSNSSRQPPSQSTHPPRPPNAPLHGASGMVMTDLVVPDKSTLVVENNDDAYDNQISTDIKPIEPPSRSVSIEKAEPRDRRQGPLERRRSGSLSSLKYISHKQNGSDLHATPNRPVSRDRNNSNASRFSVNEYDRRVSVMQSKITLLEKELQESQSTHSRTKSSVARLEKCEEELLHWKRICEEQKRQLKDLQQSLDDEKKLNFEQLSSAEQETKQLKHEISNLNRRIESNQHATMARSSTNSNDPMVAKLKAEVVALLDELRQMQSRQDQLLVEQDNFQEVIRDLESAVSHHKKRYEAAKAELRTVRRTSTQYSSKEFLPNEKPAISENGGIVDIHFTMFTTSIDDLLRAGRSNVTSELISVMRTVIDSVGDIDEDVQQFEVHSSVNSKLSLEEQEKLDVLKGRINATLSNLITACKNHLTSFGLSPISLLDAAASHLCFSLVELVQLVGMRRANAAEIEIHENFHSQRSKYDDDDTDGNNGVVDTGFKLRTAVGDISNRNVRKGSPRRWNDESSAPPKVNKDVFNRGDKSNDSNVLRNGTPNSNSNVLGNFLDRIRTTSGGGANSSATKPIKPLNSNEKNLEQPAISRTQNIANKFEDLRSPSGFEYGSNASDLRDSASGSSTNPDKVFDSPPRNNRNFPRPIPPRGELSDSSSRPTQISNFQTGISKSNNQDYDKLKVYLDSQTELIVGSIQSLLSAIRGTAAMTNDSRATTEMRTNLDQIIKVVSDITAKCSSDQYQNDSKFESLLDELNENCKKLNQFNDFGLNQGNNNTTTYGVHQAAGFSKQMKQSVAAASFGVAKALRELNAHVSGTEESLL